jgi:2-polyprenyl-3-methyl-5-hydroxy-6-metoxy-1,4-benzoquinol methylase
MIIMNKYDDVRLNVAKLIHEQDARLGDFDPQARSGDHLGFPGYLKSYLKLCTTRLLVRAGLYHKLVYANLRLDWFHEFRRYWVEELGNRPLRPHDFYFLYGSYRSRFSEEVEVPDSTSDEQLLDAWRAHRTVYLLFFNQYKLALDPLYVERFIKYIPKGGHVCEYGCGLAPVASSLCKYYPHLNVGITCADIPHIMFHFTRWKFRNTEYVRLINIDPYDDAPLTDMYDTVFCVTVLEHLPRPLPVLRHLYSHIKPGGHFVFDYIKSEGKGLNTVSALADRIPALQYIANNFEVIEGRVPLDGGHVGTVVCRKPG